MLLAKWCRTPLCWTWLCLHKGSRASGTACSRVWVFRAPPLHVLILRSRVAVQQHQELLQRRSVWPLLAVLQFISFSDQEVWPFFVQVVLRGKGLPGGKLVARRDWSLVELLLASPPPPTTWLGVQAVRAEQDIRVHTCVVLCSVWNCVLFAGQPAAQGPAGLCYSIWQCVSAKPTAALVHAATLLPFSALPSWCLCCMQLKRCQVPGVLLPLQGIEGSSVELIAAVADADGRAAMYGECLAAWLPG